MTLRLPLPIVFLVAALAAGEERTYSVTHDGQSAGKIVAVFSDRVGSETAVVVRADIPRTSNGLFSLDYHGTERWTGRLLGSLEATGTASGRSGKVTLTAGTSGYTLKAGVKDVTVRGDPWPTTFMILPDTVRPLVVDVVTGDVFRARLDRVGRDRVTVAGKVVETTRYRLTAGGTVSDLWYDDRHRLRKRTWTWNGQPWQMVQVEAKSE